MLKDEDEPNLSYQSHGDLKGGSDSHQKLACLRLPQLRGKRFLDLGCNAGYFCAYAAAQGAEYVLGIDNSDRVLAIARERYPGLAFRGGGWDDYPEGEYDVVICLSAIHYAKDPAKLSSDVGRSLGTDGQWVLEGGVFAADRGDFWSDVRVPVWREIGDKVHHLSIGYLRNHLLRSFDWRVVGPSIAQRGDPVARYVVHASSWRESEAAPFVHQVCVLEYTDALSLSADTISPSAASHGYVSSLRHFSLDDPSPLQTLFKDREMITAYASDLVDALDSHCDDLRIRWPRGLPGQDEFRKALEECGVRPLLRETFLGQLD